MSITALFAGFFSGLLASLGLGGGSVLVLYLIFFESTPPAKAAGINLLFFIPIAALSLIIYVIKKQIRFKRVVFLISGGVVGCVIGALSAASFKNSFLTKIFGIFICFLGIKEIIVSVKLYLKKNKNSDIITKE